MANSDRLLLKILKQMLKTNEWLEIILWNFDKNTYSSEKAGMYNILDK